MTINEINEKLRDLDQITADLAEFYEEGGGEITPESEALELRLGEITSLLTDATDDLGRWLRSKEDEVKAFKAEKDHAARRQKAAEETVDFIKQMIRRVLNALGQDDAKGSLGYKFAVYDSKTTTADKELIKMRWQGTAERAIREAGVPSYITVTLGASASLAEGQDTDVFRTSITPTVKFTKPRANKE